MSMYGLKIRIPKTASASPVDNWFAELVGDPDIASDALYPFLSFRVRITNRHNQQRGINNISGSLFIGKEAQNQIEFVYLAPIIIANIFPQASTTTNLQQDVSLTIPPQRSIDIYALAELSPVALSKIEKLREGEDLLFVIRLNLWVGAKTTALSVSHAGRPYIRVAKSDWAERILKRTGYMEVTVVELPEPIDIPELRNALDYLKNAWKSYHIGEYYDAVTNVRRALDALVKGLQNYDASLVEERTENDRTIREPKFSAFAITGKREKEAIAKVYRALRSALGGLSAHEGAINVDRQLAEFAVVAGQALLRYFTARLKHKGEA